MQFKVPQFLEIEDKIFGPFTFRQFVYLVGGAGLGFIIFKLVGFIWGAIPILAIMGFSAMLAFYRPNDKPFINMLEASLKYFSQNKLYLWKKRTVKIDPTKQAMPQESVYRSEPKLNQSKLRDLAWSLDVLDLKKEENQN